MVTLPHHTRGDRREAPRLILRGPSSRPEKHVFFVYYRCCSQGVNMIITDEGIEIPAADEVAAIIEGQGESAYVGNTKVISVRLSKHLAAKIQALCHKSGKTRNAMLCNLLDVGVEEVTKRLKPETLAQLQELESEALSDQSGEA